MSKDYRACLIMGRVHIKQDFIEVAYPNKAGKRKVCKNCMQTEEQVRR